MHPRGHGLPDGAGAAPRHFCPGGGSGGGGHERGFGRARRLHRRRGDVRRANRQSLDLDGLTVENFARCRVGAGCDPRGGARRRGQRRAPARRGRGAPCWNGCTGSDPDLPVILITGHGDISMAVAALPRRGGRLPRQALSGRRPRRLGAPGLEERRRLVVGEPAPAGEPRCGARRRSAFLGISPRSSACAGWCATWRRRMSTCSSSGETAPARRWWRAPSTVSRRAEAQLRAMNCGALPDSVVESELFGHEAGAFTGALKRRIGRIEHAQGGTLFSGRDREHAALAAGEAARVLQERSVEPLGTNEIRPIDMRVVAATKVDLGLAAAQGTFPRRPLTPAQRHLAVAIPPLRERREDIKLLFQHFLAKAAARFGREAPPVTRAVRDHLQRHAWPGNVRELGHFADAAPSASCPRTGRARRTSPPRRWPSGSSATSATSSATS